MSRFWSLSNRTLIMLIIAIVLPLSFIAVTGVQSALNTTQELVSNYVSENGALRQNVLGSNFEAVLREIDYFEQTYLTDNDLLRNILAGDLSPFLAEQGGRVFQALTERNLLIANDATIFSAALVDLTGRVVAQARLDEAEISLPDTFDSILSSASLRELAQLERTHTLLLTPVDDVNVLLLLTRLEIDGRTSAFLATSLNIEALFIAPLTPAGITNATYSYLIAPPEAGLPAEEAVLMPSVVRDSGLAGPKSLNTLGAVRALDGQRGVAEYTIDGRPVVGYYAPFTLLDLSFGMVTELDRGAATTGIFQRAAGILLGGLLAVVVLLLVLMFWYQRGVIRPLQAIRTGIIALGRGEYRPLRSIVQRADEIGSLGRALDESYHSLEDAADQHEQRLIQLSRDLRVTQEISRAAAAQRNLNQLMNTVIQQIIENFPSIYHAQIFLLDEAGRYAVLRASTGKVGQELLARGHRLEVGSVSVIGQVSQQGEVVIARDTASSQVHRRNEFLPDTRAELAIPLKSGALVIGALDVQSRQGNSFDADQVEALQTLADQITVAIENARLYEQSQRLLRSLERERAESVRAGWLNVARRQRRGLIRDSGNPTPTDFSPLITEARRTQRAAIGAVTEYDTVPFVVPIMLRDIVLGTVEYEVRAGDFNLDQVALAEELVNRLAIGLDNARLFQQSQQAAERERIVNDITARIEGQATVEDILQTAVSEISRALGTPRVGITLRNGQIEDGGIGGGKRDSATHTNANGTTNGTANGTANGSNGSGSAVYGQTPPDEQ